MIQESPLVAIKAARINAKSITIRKAKAFFKQISPRWIFFYKSAYTYKKKSKSRLPQPDGYDRARSAVLNTMMLHV